MKIVNPAILDDYRVAGKCELCGVYCRRREAFHLMARGRGGAFQLDIPENLLGSCASCHSRHHTSGGMIDQAADAIGAREGLWPNDLLDVLRRLRWAKEEQPNDRILP